MKDAAHPEYKEINVNCTCGNSFKTGSTLGHDLQVEVCSSCHPFYTGKQKMVDTAGRVDKFRKKYAAPAAPAPAAARADRKRPFHMLIDPTLASLPRRCGEAGAYLFAI